MATAFVMTSGYYSPPQLLSIYFKNKFIINQDSNYSQINIHKNEPELTITNIKIIDITGNTLQEISGDELFNSVINISTNALSSGTYFLSITTDTGTANHQFFIVR